MRRRRLRPTKGLLLMLAALLLLLPVYARPQLTMPGLSYAYLFVIDISQSMNVADQPDADGRTQTRLAAARAAVIAGLRQLPCGSLAALGLFADDETLMVFEPLEVCAHYPAMEKVVAGISWRMAWGGNSQIDAGLQSAAREAIERHLNLVFVSDGDEAPRREALRLDKLRTQRGKLKGLLIGVGGEQERPVPRLDEHDEVVGYWQVQDAVRNGGNPNLAAMLQNLQPDEAVPAEMLRGAPEFQSAQRVETLRQLAEAEGLQYRALRSQRDFNHALSAASLGELRQVPRDLRPAFALGSALLLLLACLLPSRMTALRRLGHIRHTAGARPTQAQR